MALLTEKEIKELLIGAIGGSLKNPENSWRRGYAVGLQVAIGLTLEEAKDLYDEKVLRDLIHEDYKTNGFWHALEIHNTLEAIIKDGSNDFQPVLDKLVQP